MNAPPTGTEPIVVDGMLCAVLLLHLRARIAGAAPGTVVHLVADDPPRLWTWPPDAT